MTGEDIRWGIASFRRPEVCANATVATLLSSGVHPEAITVFLSDPAEKKEYVEALTGTGVSIREGAPGAAGNKRSIQRFYEPETRLMSCDDDLKGLFTKPIEGSRLEPLTVSLPELASGVFDRAAEAGARLWGLSGAANSQPHRDSWVTLHHRMFFRLSHP